MSYEGYTQYLCKNGHEGVRDCNEPDLKKCDFCGALIVWHYSVDITNGSDPETGEGMRYDLEVDTPAKTCVCPTCKNAHITEPVRYKIPINAGHLFDENKNKWVSLWPQEEENNYPWETFE